MIYVIVFAIALVGGAIYIAITLMEVPGMAEERLGRFEPLPANLNKWEIDRESEAGQAALKRGLQRETRLWQDPSGGFVGRERLIRQTRFRNVQTDEIDAVEPDVRYRRRRIRK